MTGLDLEQYLRMLRADPMSWINGAIITSFLILILWASRGRRRVLQRCLIVSLVMHLGLVVYGGPRAALWFGNSASNDVPGTSGEHLQRVELIDRLPQRGGLADSNRPDQDPSTNAERTSALQPWDHPEELLVSETPAPNPPPIAPREFEPAPRGENDLSELTQLVEVPDPALPASVIPQDRAQTQPDPLANLPDSNLPIGDQEKAPVALNENPTQPKGQQEQAGPELSEVASRSPTPARRDPTISRESALDLGSAPPEPGALTIQPSAPPRPSAEPLTGGNRLDAPVSIAGEGRPTPTVSTPTDVPGPGVGASSGASLGTDLAVPELDLNHVGGGGTAARGPGGGRAGSTTLAMRGAGSGSTGATVPIMRSNPLDRTGSGNLPGRTGTPNARPLPDVPDVYRSRLAPDRSARAFAAGATPASEAAVESALDWLARHQDADGRWNGGTHLTREGQPLNSDTSFTAHCPAGDICAGECFYWEADTAMTGLALLAFLGAGHTHQAGPYARNVALGVNFLLTQQKVDGDLRGNGLSVGLYCHAIATLALTEAYALTGDERLRKPIARALEFLIQARSTDKQAWRYRPPNPRDPMTFNGDTSILGWAVMALKSGKEVGFPIPEDVRAGIVTWLERVADGPSRGLAMYRPPGLSEGGEVRPSMTAEAWVCRQFLGLGGPSTASDEAAAYLLQHGPDRDPYNLYYWYYGTLALFQHGGEPWVRWNARVRDQLVRRQVRSGHAQGSWDPADCRDKYNDKGGRIYTTAIAALTLEVYYRYLRLYDAPATPLPENAGDPNLRRARLDANPEELERAPTPEVSRP